jgi:hypothetical protein
MNIRTISTSILCAAALYPACQAQTTSVTPIAATAPTAVPALIPYGSTAIAADGKPLSNESSVTFLIFKDESGGQPVWTETQMVSPDRAGQYSVKLGASSPLGVPLEVFANGTARWLEVQIAGQKPQPRILLATVPYAAKAADATTLGGLPASAFALAGSSSSGTSSTSASPSDTSTVTTIGGSIHNIPIFTGATTIANSEIYDTGTSVGIGGVPNASARLDVKGSMIMRGNMIVSRAGNATASKGYPSYGFDFFSNVYNSSTKTTANPYFSLVSEPAGNNTASPSATFNLRYSATGTEAETGFYINPNGTVHFGSGQSFPGAVSSVAISPPASDFNITSGPVTGSGTLSFAWTVAPTSYIVANSIVKRDQSGNTSINNLNANAVNSYGTMFVAQGFTEDGPATFAKTVGIGTTTPQAELNLNAGGTANADTLLIGNNVNKGLQLRDTGTGVDIESISSPLFLNYVTQAPIYLNTAAGAVLIHDGSSAGGGDGTTLPALTVGGNPNSSIFFNEPYSAHFKGDVLADDGIATPDAVRSLIDHPLDPTNKYLVHASIASSEALNQYSGNVTTDELGLATVHLPDWFESENADFRYQLTVISGQFAQAVISKKVAHNQFTIGTNAPRVEVSWMLTAKRNDPYAKAHAMVVEQEKPATQRGTYMHPELYGQPESKRTGGPRQPQGSLQEVPTAAAKP